MNESPLGAAALAGTSFPIDRQMTAEALGFERPTANSLDSVSDRDFALEALSAASICAVHLSRLAEELVIWTTPQFGFVRLSDAFSTGSSIMPQKRNPDAAELIRAKAGRIVGAQTALLMVMKGLPLAYCKDMQEDKEPVFEAFDALELSLKAMAGMAADLKPDLVRMAAAGRLRLLHGHRSRGLVGGAAGHAVPRRPPRRRRGGQAGRGDGRGAVGPAAGRAAGDRAADHGGGL